MPDPTTDSDWKSLRARFFLRSLLPTAAAVLVGVYVEALLFEVAWGEHKLFLALVTAASALPFAIAQPFFVAGYLCRRAVAVRPTDAPGARLQRLLELPRKLEMWSLGPSFAVGALVFTTACCVQFGKSLVLIPAGVAMALALGALIGIPASLAFQTDVLPVALAELQRDPRQHPRGSGLAWPRQSWYLPYVFVVLLVLVVVDSGIIVGKGIFGIVSRLLQQIERSVDAQTALALQHEVNEELLGLVGPVLFVCLVLLGIFTVSGWLMGQREQRAAQAIERALSKLASGAPELPTWIGTDEVGDIAFAVAVVNTDMQKVFAQLGAMAEGNLSVQLDGESGLIAAFRASQSGLRQLSEQMKILSLGNTASRARLVGDLGDAFGQLSLALGATIAQAKTIALGDLRADVQVEGELGIAINQMTTKLRGMVRQTQEVGHNIGEIVVSLRSAATQLSTATTEQVSALTETANTMTEMSQTSAASADRCAELIRQGDSASAVVEEGKSGAFDAGQAMEAISASLGKVSAVSSVLAEKVQQIDGIIETVSFLADQSSTLAINAGIEASRAGEAGRGFTAVAREMRTLAGDSRKATGQIREILQEIRQKTVQVDSSVAAGGSTIADGVRLVNRLGSAIGQLGVTIHDAVGLMRQVEGSARQHQAGVSQVTQALRSMQTASESIRDGARLLSGLSEQATGLATSLQTTAGAYQLPARTEVKA